MESRERFISTLYVKPTDKIPLFEFLDSQNLFEHLTGIRPSTYDTELAVDCSFKLDFDAVWAPFGGISAFADEESFGKDIYVDEWGVTYKKTEFSWPCDSPVAFPVKTQKDLSKMVVPDANRPDRLVDIKKAQKLTDGKMAVIGGICGPFTIVYLGMGYEGLSFATIDNPRLVDEFHEIAADFLIKAAKQMIKAGVDAVYIGEDLGFNAAPFLSPQQFRKFTFPHLKKLIRTIRENNIPVILHSDGNLNLILDDLVEMGINALNPIEANAKMDLKKIKDRYGKNICLLGGINNDILCNGTPEDVSKEVKRVIDIAAPEGGFIPASDSGDFRNEMPLENVLAAVETIKKYRDL
jgi:uroporphyrinogen-III decarboxylase